MLPLVPPVPSTTEPPLIGAARIGRIPGNRQSAGAILDQWAIADGTVGEERRVWHRIIISEAELQNRGLREITRDIVKSEDTAAKGTDSKHIDCRVIGECTDLGIR